MSPFAPQPNEKYVPFSLLRMNHSPVAGRNTVASVACRLRRRLQFGVQRTERQAFLYRVSAKPQDVKTSTPRIRRGRSSVF